MSVDRPPKRKAAAQRDSVSPQTPAKKNRPKSRTADNLEALLDLLDEDEPSAAAAAAGRRPRRTTSGRASRPAPGKPPSIGVAPSFMQELARARAELHREHRARIALEEVVKSLRSELTRLAANDSAQVEELQRECQGMQRQLAAIEKQRQQLKDALFVLESELEAEQQQRERLNDQVDALRQRLAQIEPGSESS